MGSATSGYSSDVTPRASDLKRPGFQDAWVQAPQPGNVQIDWGIRYVLSAASWAHHGTKTVKNLGVTSGRLVLRGGALGVLQAKSNTAPGQCGCDLAIAEAGHLPSFLPSFLQFLTAAMCSINECNQKAILYAYITYMQTCFVLVDIY